MVAVFLAEGFEEIEALSVIDILRRAGIDVKTVGVGGKVIKGTHGVPVEADVKFEDLNKAEVEAIALPGGMPGTSNLENYQPLRDMIAEFAKQEKPIFAICAAPMILGRMGILDGKKATSYPDCKVNLGGAIVVEDNVCRDGNIITGDGPAAAPYFAFEIVSMLKGDEIVKELKYGMGYER